jgi:hypothetical protein
MKRKLIRVVGIGKGRYIAIGRLLPSIKPGDLLEATIIRSNGEIVLKLTRYKVVEA